jgi:hypothetical protein
MFEDYKVVVVCPCGRRRVADLMRRHVEHARPLVDELHWWLNTDNQEDLAYFRGLEQAAPGFYRTFDLPGARFGGRHTTINRFFVHAIDPETIYIRIDDDVVWMDEHCIEQLVRHRLKFPEAYLVYGNIVNSSRFMHLHQQQGAFDPGFEISYEINHKTNRQSLSAGLAAHKAILKTIEALTAGGDRETLLAPWTSFGRHVFGPNVHNDVNMISWFGRDFAAWRGICPRNVYEEKWICFMMPAKHGCRIHEACGNALCVHYASVMQWDGLERHRPALVAQYAQFAPPSMLVRWTEPAQPDGRSPAHADAVS